MNGTAETVRLARLNPLGHGRLRHQVGLRDLTCGQTAEEIQQAAVAETARVLIAAGLIEEAAAQDVLETLVAADLIKQEALGEARAAVEQANAEVTPDKATQNGR